MSLPEITAVERFQYKPGDRFLLRYAGEHFMTEQSAHELAERFRRMLQLPDDVPIAIVSDDWRVQIVSPSVDRDE